MEEIMQLVLMYAVFNSLIVGGILDTVKKLFHVGEKNSRFKTLPRWIGIGITYIVAFAFGFRWMYEVGWFEFIIYSLTIGCLSILLYESIIKSMKDLIPRLIDRFLGTKE